MPTPTYLFNEHLFIKGFTYPELEILAEQLRYSLAGKQETARGQAHLAPHGVVLLKEAQLLERLLASITASTAPGYTVNIPVAAADVQFTLEFFHYEHHRSRLGVPYITREAFDPPTKRCLLRLLDIELRFFSQAVQALRRLPYHPPSPPMVTFHEIANGVQTR